jgi:choline dehydrogenase-like flavoprotein
MRLHHKNGRITGAAGRILTEDGPVSLEIEADWVVLSAGAIQTPVLLRASWIKRNIGNSLRIHPMLKMAAQYDEVLDSHRAPLPIYQVKEFWPEITIGGSVFTPGFLAMTLSDNWSRSQHAMKDWRQMALYHAACRGTSLGKVRCFPINNEAVVQYTLSERDRMHLTLGIARLGEALFAAGARKLYPGLRRPAEINSVEECRRMAENPLPLADMSVSTVHVFSSCPMGEDRERCAVDSFGQVHGFKNLRIADASIIPDSPGVNPQGTTMALALRNARHFISTVRK